jgi:phosphate transport system protein
MTESEQGFIARSSLDHELVSLQEDVLRMSGFVEQAVTSSLYALETRDEVMATEIIAADARVNALRFHVEEACLGLIATQQPAAVDLRTVITVLNMVSDLERMGDHAAGIAKVVLRLPGMAVFETPRSLIEMSEQAIEMLRKVMVAFINRDEKLAHSVASQDEVMDERYRALFEEVMGMMGQASARAKSGLYLLFVGHNLERIADRVTNLAERVIFLSSGRMRELNPEGGESAWN